MQEIIDSSLVPDSVRRVLVLCLTLAAALLYGALMGFAIYGAFAGITRSYNDDTAARAASLLSGLVGSVVTAGFSRSKRPETVQLSADHPMGGRAVTAWRSLKPDSLIKANLLGLGGMLGFPTQPLAPASSRATDELVPPVEPDVNALAMWVALVYIAIYILVGVASFATMFWAPSPPDLVVDAGWVWLGTVVSSGYSFFALNDRS